jgi:hypothetical protein
MAIGATDRAALLRRALRADGLFELVVGAGLLAGARRVAAFFGLASAAPVAGAGLGLLGYAAWLLDLAARRPLDPRMGLLAAAANTAGAGALAVPLVAGRPPLSAGGRHAVAATGLIVAGFAAIQSWAVRRMVQPGREE